MVRRVRGFLILMGLITTFSTFAQMVELEKILVSTPYKSETAYGQIGRSITYISRDEIEKSKARNLSDILDGLVSTYLRDYGALGASKTISIRGSSSSQVLVLLNGRPLNNPRSGEVDFSTFPLDLVDHIEILRGPASSIYGANALGGVINIISRRKPSKSQFSMSTQYGTYQTFINEIHFAQNYGNWDFSFTSNHSNSWGHRRNSYFESNNFYLNLGYRYNDGEIELLSNYYADNQGLPGLITSPDDDDRQMVERRIIDLNGKHELNEVLKLNYKFYRHYDRLDFIETPSPLDKTVHKTEWYGTDISLDFDLDLFSLIMGYNYQYNTNNSTQTGKNAYRQNSLYFLLRRKFGDKLEMDLGARYDDYSIFGSEFNPSLGATLNSGFGKIYTYLARSYRVPTFNDLYWPEGTWTAGNPELKPEEGISWEVGWEGAIWETNLKLSYFQSKMKDLINWAADSSGVWRPSNVDRAKIQGIEFYWEKDLFETISASFGYTYLRARDTRRKEYLIYRPNHKLDFSISFSYQKFNFRLENQYLSQRFTNTSNTDRLSDYFISNLSGSYSLNSSWELFFKIYNLFNRQYARIKDYPLPGFTLLSGMKVFF